jgi:non-ribosomal peptide synthase protein (TIGR01720 family)
VDLESHGRTSVWDDLDVGAAVGWFTSIFPVRLGRASGADAVARVAAVTRALADVPRHGLGFGVLSEIAGAPDHPAPLCDAPPRSIGFNYLGDLGAGAALPRGLTLLDAPLGQETHPGQMPAHPLELDAGVTGGALRMSWRSDARVLDDATVTALAAAHHRALVDLVDRLPASHQLPLDEDELADVLAEIGE